MKWIKKTVVFYFWSFVVLGVISAPTVKQFAMHAGSTGIKFFSNLSVSFLSSCAKEQDQKITEINQQKALVKKLRDTASSSDQAAHDQLLADLEARELKSKADLGDVLNQADLISNTLQSFTKQHAKERGYLNIDQWELQQRLQLSENQLKYEADLASKKQAALNQENLLLKQNLELIKNEFSEFKKHYFKLQEQLTSSEISPEKSTSVTNQTNSIQQIIRLP